MAKIKLGDMVIIRAGKNRGEKGKVINILPGDKVVVEGINLRKKMVRSTAKKSGDKPQQIERPYPVHISNVGIADPKTGKATRVGYSVEKGKKIRIAKKSGTII